MQDCNHLLTPTQARSSGETDELRIYIIVRPQTDIQSVLAVISHRARSETMKTGGATFGGFISKKNHETLALWAL